ncbi:MAG: dihydrolipoyllysine-residue succinyltransferase [Flavobacteriales bacterium]|nr:dihydrolipoyllysine-residue succinyltransferase [Flavobacteriales bacterium]|tara:strand:+ start:10 stop:1191 length:1182 start_codon:yes stop_codon:yes gene_type:complete
MLLEMKVPSPGESISEVEIAQWLVEDGDYVEKDQEIAEVDSDKATLALPAEESGTIRLVAEEGDTVNVGQVVCIIDTAGIGKAKTTESDQELAPAVSAPSPTKSVDAKATPLAKAIISQNDLSPKDVKGSGEGGKILKEDVIEAMSSVKTDGPRGTERKKMSMLRRKVAQRLVSVKNETAMLTTFNEVDMSTISAIRKEYKEAFKDKYDVSLGFMSFFTKAITTALMEFPDVNAQIDGNEVIYHNYADISIAVSAPKGLMVPVIRNAELMCFNEIESEVKRLALRARDGQITPDEMLGGTFTITNGGVFGSMLSTPIINPPQSAILGMHNIVERPIAVNGKVEIRPIMYVALSYDHRIIDGRESVGFLVRVKECLEDPNTHLLNGNTKQGLAL